MAEIKLADVRQIAPVFSTSTACAVGDYVIYQGLLYECIAPHAAGAWNASHFEEVSVGQALKGINESLLTKAEIDGYYDGMTVGDAEQLVSTVYVEDSAPYNFRTSGGSADISNREYTELIGGTVAWNQLVPTASRTFVNTSTESSNNMNFLFRLNLSPWTQFYSRQANAEYFGNFSFISKATATGKAQIIHNGQRTQMKFADSIDVITNHVYLGHLNFTSTDLTTVGGLVANDISLYDLTAMFGSTVADYIYSLEQAHAGDGVAWFRKYFPKPYYSYNAGTLMSVKTPKHVMTGFNQWDEEWEVGVISSSTGANVSDNNHICSKNFCRCLPNTTYYAQIPSPYFIRMYWYDADKNFISAPTASRSWTYTTPNNCYYFKLVSWDASYGTTYKNDICINLSWSGYRNGEYEPYVKRSYPLDSSLTLRGIPKLDSANKLYYDGDTYESDGTVTRKRAVIVLNGTQAVSSSTIVERTNTVRVYIPTASFNPPMKPNTSTTNIEIVSVAPVYAPDYIAQNDVIGISENRNATNNGIWIGIDKTKLSAYDSNAIKAYLAANPITVEYLVATPTTEEAEPFQNPQVCDDFGTEEYIDYAFTEGERDVAVPVGHVTEYQSNLRDKLQRLPDMPSSNGDFVVRYADRQCSLVPYTAELPTVPTDNGTYVLKAVKSGSTVTYTWEAE